MPASAAACFRNRLRPEPLDSMIASRDPEFSDLSFGLARLSLSSPTNIIVFGKIASVSTEVSVFVPVFPVVGHF
jgi:hypothetical protein